MHDPRDSLMAYSHAAARELHCNPTVAIATALLECDLLNGRPRFGFLIAGSVSF